MYASGNGYIDVVNALILTGAALDIETDPHRLTALDFAFYTGCAKTERALIAAGATDPPTSSGQPSTVAMGLHGDGNCTCEFCKMQVLSEDIKRGNFKLKKVAKQPSAYAYGDVKAELKAGNFKLKKASKISPTSETYIAPFAADADSNDAQFTIQPMTNEEIMR